MSEEDDSIWYAMPLTKRQIHLLRMLARFHLQQSHNDRAKDETRRFLTCLERWPKPIQNRYDLANVTPLENP